MLQFALQRQALARLALEAVVVELHALPALHLHAVHRHVGAADQPIDRAPIVGRHGDTDTGRDLDRPSVEVERVAEGLEDAADGLPDVVHGVAVVDIERELVAAQPRDRIGAAHAMAESLRHLGEQQVAGLVAERVVDQLEVVEVEEDDRQLLRVRVLCEQAARQLLQKALAVQQPGQLIVLRHVEDAALRPLLVGDVLEDGDEVLDVANRMADRARGLLGVHLIAARAAQDGLAAPRLPRAMTGVQHVVEVHARLRRQRQRRDVDAVPDAEARELGEGGIDPVEATVDAGDADGIGRGFQRRRLPVHPLEQPA